MTESTWWGFFFLAVTIVGFASMLWLIYSDTKRIDDFESRRNQLYLLYLNKYNRLAETIRSLQSEVDKLDVAVNGAKPPKLHAPIQMGDEFEYGGRANPNTLTEGDFVDDE